MDTWKTLRTVMRRVSQRAIWRAKAAALVTQAAPQARPQIDGDRQRGEVPGCQPPMRVDGPRARPAIAYINTPRGTRAFDDGREFMSATNMDSRRVLMLSPHAEEAPASALRRSMLVWLLIAGHARSLAR